MPNKSKGDRVLLSVRQTSMSNASFHNFHSRSDGLRYDFSTNKRPRGIKADTFFKFSVIIIVSV